MSSPTLFLGLSEYCSVHSSFLTPQAPLRASSVSVLSLPIAHVTLHIPSTPSVLWPPLTAPPSHLLLSVLSHQDPVSLHGQERPNTDCCGYHSQEPSFTFYPDHRGRKDLSAAADRGYKLRGHRCHTSGCGSHLGSEASTHLECDFRGWMGGCPATLQTGSQV